MRLIDADALKERLKEYCIDGDEQAVQWYDIMGIDETIDNAPTIDAVQVIRCKDCKYYDTPKNFKKPYCMRGAYVKVNADDYCSKGERK